MTKKNLIHRTVETLEKLPEDRINEIADFVLKKYEEQVLQKGVEAIISKSNSFSFLHDQEDLYGESVLKEKY